MVFLRLNYKLCTKLLKLPKINICINQHKGIIVVIYVVAKDKSLVSQSLLRCTISFLTIILIGKGYELNF